MGESLKISRGNYMIGISIYSDCVRAVRLSKTKKEYKLKQCYSQPLYDGDIVQGKIKNLDSFKSALKELKGKMKITDDEEVFIGIPNVVAKIDSIVVDNMVSDLSAIINEIHIIGNKNDYEISVPFISPAYKMRFHDKNPQYNDKGEEKLASKLIKTVSYCAVPKNIIKEYSNAFLDENYNIVTIEPNSVAIVRYLREKIAQPALILDVEFNYSTFIIYSEKHGLFVMTSNNTGIDNLINYTEDENGEIVESTKNHQALIKFWNAAKLAEKYYKEINIVVNNQKLMNEDEKEIKQIIFMNNDDSFITEELDDNTFATAEILSSQNMLPEFLSSKIDKKAFVPNLYDYYIPIVLAFNSKSLEVNLDDVNKNIEVNFVPKECIDNSLYKSIKSKTSKGLIGALVLAGLYSLSMVGLNIKDVYSNTDAEKVTPELKAKYDDAKKQEQTMKDNIVKYNTVAFNKNVASPIIDTLVLAKPADVYLTNIEMNAKKERVILECITENKMSSDIFLQQIKMNPELVGAQILSLQTKNNKTAFQITIPIGKDGASNTNTSPSKAKSDSANNSSQNTSNTKLDNVLNGK